MSGEASEGPYGPVPFDRMYPASPSQIVIRELQQTTTEFRQLLASVSGEKQKTVKDLIEQLPKEVNVQQLVRNIRSRFQQLENAKAVAEKYEGYNRDDTIPPQLRSSATMQWPSFYLMCATPVTHEFDMEFLQDAENYKVDVRFQDLVRSHQKSQREFLRLHAQQCHQTAIDRTSIASLQAMADEIVFVHCEVYLGDYEDGVLAQKKRSLTKILYDLVALLREQNVFQLKSRAKKEQDKKKKREEALSKAELAWEALPPTALVGLAVHQETSGGSSTSRAHGQERISVGSNQVLRRLLQPHEAQLKDLGFILDASSQSSNTKPKQRGRSPSAETASPRSILKPSRTRSPTPRGTRPHSSPKGSLSRSPSRSSAGSKSRGKGREFADGRNKGKGKGTSDKGQQKGKGKGKADGKSKGQGKQKGKGKGGQRHVRFRE